MFGPAVTIATICPGVTIGEKDKMYYYKDWKLTSEDLEEEHRLW